LRQPDRRGLATYFGKEENKAKEEVNIESEKVNSSNGKERGR